MSKHRESVWIVAAAALILGTLAASTASAQITDEEKRYLEEKRKGPSEVYVIAPRLWAVTIPGFILDQFFDRHASTWEGGTNLATGLEFIWRTPKSHEFVFSLDYTDLTMRDEWWVEADKPVRQADWTEFGLSLITLEVGYNGIWPISDVFSFYAGAGLGLSLVLGEVQKTDPTLACIQSLGNSRNSSDLERPPCENQGQPALEAGSTEPEDDIPPVIPLPHVLGGAQITVAEHLAIRLQVGWRVYFYGGLSVGYEWF